MSAEVNHTGAGDVGRGGSHSAGDVDDAALAQVTRAEVGHTGAGDVDDAALAHVIRAEVGHRGVGDVGRGESHTCRGCWPRWVTQCRGCRPRWVTQVQGMLMMLPLRK